MKAKLTKSFCTDEGDCFPETIEVTFHKDYKKLISETNKHVANCPTVVFSTNIETDEILTIETDIDIDVNYISIHSRDCWCLYVQHSHDSRISAEYELTN